MPPPSSIDAGPAFAPQRGMSHRIILVGHCGVDAPRLESEISRQLEGAEVVTVTSDESLERACEEGADLFLFNREMPFGFESDQGLEMIRALHERHPDLKVMLISDFEDAQSEAKQAGAVE